MQNGLVAIGLAALLTGPLSAQEQTGQPTTDRLGAWTLTTTEFGGSICQLDGVLRLAHEPTNGVVACSLTVTQSCKLNDFQPVTAFQSRQARQTGDRLDVQSFVERTDPASLGYLPDSFSLQIRNANLMTGRHLTPHHMITAKFTRLTQDIA